MFWWRTAKTPRLDKKEHNGGQEIYSAVLCVWFPWNEGDDDRDHELPKIKM